MVWKKEKKCESMGIEEEDRREMGGLNVEGSKINYSKLYIYKVLEIF